MEAKTNAVAICPKCDCYMHSDGHNAIFCANPRCELYKVQFECPKITLNEVSATKSLP